MVSSRRFLYSGWDLLAEFDAPGGTALGALVRSFTWGLDLVGSLSASGGVGALLQITDHQSSISYLPTYDGNGNVASLLNADTGALEAAYEYDPFGQLLRAEGAYAKENPFRFSTKFQDEETGLIYYGYRYYSAALGRFVNRDPIEEAGGLNLYGFAGNDGVNGVDYLGLDRDLVRSRIIRLVPNAGFTPNFGVRVGGGGRSRRTANVTRVQAAPPNSVDRGQLAPRVESPTDARPILTGQIDGDVIGRLPSFGEPCIRCHGVDASGFNGDPTDFAGVIGIDPQLAKLETRILAAVGPQAGTTVFLMVGAALVPGAGEALAISVLFDDEASNSEKILAAATLGASGAIRVVRIAPSAVNTAVVADTVNAPMVQAELLASSSGARILVLDASRFPVSAANQAEAVANGARTILSVNRAGAAANREAALEGLPKFRGLDLDEAPPAFLRQPGDVVIVRPTPPADNRGAGASLGNQARGVSDGGRVIIIIVNGNPGG